MNGILLDVDRLTAYPCPAGLSPVAEKVMRQAPLSVAHKPAPPPGGTLHDYFSVGPYWWPDPGKPDGLPWIRRDGQVHPDFYSDAYDRKRIERLATVVPTLAVAGLVQRQKPYADRAALLIRTFFLDASTRMNPNLVFGQSIP